MEHKNSLKAYKFIINNFDPELCPIWTIVGLVFNILDWAQDLHDSGQAWAQTYLFVEIYKTVLKKQSTENVNRNQVLTKHLAPIYDSCHSGQLIGEVVLYSVDRESIICVLSFCRNGDPIEKVDEQGRSARGGVYLWRSTKFSSLVVDLLVLWVLKICLQSLKHKIRKMLSAAYKILYEASVCKNKSIMKQQLTIKTNVQFS